MARGSAKLFDQSFSLHNRLRELLAKEDWGPQWLPLRDLVKLLGPSPDYAVVDARFRRAVLDGSLVDRHGTPPGMWRRCFDEMGDISWDFCPTVPMPCDLQEEERFIYEPWFRVADWMEVFRDLIPAAQSEPGVASSTMGPDPFRTGAAGRRPAYHLIQEELERRIRTKEVKPKLRGHAAACRRLEDWWKIERKTFNPRMVRR